MDTNGARPVTACVQQYSTCTTRYTIH